MSKPVKAPARIRYLTTQRDIFYYKRDVPGKVRPFVPGQPGQWWKSLDTKNSAIAQIKLIPIAAEHDGLIRDVQAMLRRGDPAEAIKAAAEAMDVNIQATIAEVLADDSASRSRGDNTLREVMAMVGPAIADSIRSALAAYGLPQMLRAEAHSAERRAADASARAALQGMPAPVLAAYEAEQHNPFADAADGLAGGADRAPILQSLGLSSTSAAPGNDVMSVTTAYLDKTAARRPNHKTRNAIVSRVQGFIDYATRTLGACPTFGDWQALRTAAEQYLAHRGKDRDASTVRLDAGDLVRIGRFAVARGFSAADPFSALKDDLAEADNSKDHTFMPDEVHAMLEHARDGWHIDYWQALWTLAGTGLRVSECLQLRSCDVRRVTATDQRQRPGCGALGDWILDINEQPDSPALPGWDARFVKARGRKDTVRLAPIHKSLLPILLDAKARAEANKSPRLFMKAAGANVKNAGDYLGDKIKAMFAADVCNVVPGDRELQPCHGWRHTLSFIAEAAHGKLYALSLLGKATGVYGRPLKAPELREAGKLDALDVFAGAEHGPP